MTPSRILYNLSGDTVDGLPCDCRCWLCGDQISIGIPTKKWQGAKFTDQNKCRAPESDYVCDACVWVCAWSRPPGCPPPEAGKKGLNLRLFSHCYDETGYHYWNKAHKPAILAWLRGEHKGIWFAAIANSGQKHMIPWTPLNHGGLPGEGKVYFEERSLQLGNWDVVDDMTVLLTNGVTKAEVETGDYSVKSIRHSSDMIKNFETKHSSFREGAWFLLALWLSQRDENRWSEINEERRGA